MRRFAAIALPLLLGCTSVEDGAKESFAASHSCPQDRVQIRKRPDLKPSEIWMGGPLKPSPEVAADPGRLSVWQRNENERAGKENEAETVFEIRGCGHQGLYYCGRLYTLRNDGNGVACVQGEYPFGASKW